MGVKALAGPVGKFDQINRTEVYTISPPDLTAAAELRALVERLLALADQIESDREMGQVLRMRSDTPPAPSTGRTGDGRTSVGFGTGEAN